MSAKQEVKVLNRGLRAFGQVQAKLLGYIEDKGVGGTVTQATSRATGVTINKPTGVITTDDASLAAAAEVTFIVTNSEVQATDVVVISVQDAGATGTVTAYVSDVADGAFSITLANLHASTAATNAAVINFAIIRASND
jgi:hypothetical protein